jgi:hypothetical protein
MKTIIKPLHNLLHVCSRALAVTVVVVLAATLPGQAVAVTVIGSAGTLGANGVVTLPPSGAPSYGWVSTWGGVPGAGLPYILPCINCGPGNTNGSRLRTDAFAATSGDNLQFFFNYVTTDGSGFADYAWARLLDTSLTEVALLFTARTVPAGSIVPGTGMPLPASTLTPGSVPIIGGAPSWAPLGSPALGGSSGLCYSAGCGYTGWVQADYSIVSNGNYILEFGVTNWSDTHFDSGLAFSDATIGGNPITTNVVPVPAAAWLLGSSLLALTGFRRRRSRDG